MRVTYVCLWILNACIDKYLTINLTKRSEEATVCGCVRAMAGVIDRQLDQRAVRLAPSSHLHPMPSWLAVALPILALGPLALKKPREPPPIRRRAEARRRVLLCRLHF